MIAEPSIPERARCKGEGVLHIEPLSTHFDNGDTVWLIGQPIKADEPDLPECRVLVRLMDWELEDRWAGSVHLIALELVPDETWDGAASGVGYSRAEFDALLEAERLEILADHGGGLCCWESDEDEESGRDAVLELARAEVAEVRANLRGALNARYNRMGSNGWDELRSDAWGWLRRQRAHLAEGGAK